MDRLDDSATVTGVFMQPGLRAAQAAGRYRHLPASFSGFVRHVRERVELDTCILQVAPPDAAGRCSLGPAVEFSPLVSAKSRRTIALVNARTPAVPGADWLPVDAFDLMAEVDAPLPAYEVGPPSAAARTIAGHIAPYVRDGAALQVGLGKVPDALFSLLHDRRGLRLHSGMLGDGRSTSRKPGRSIRPSRIRAASGSARRTCTSGCAGGRVSGAGPAT
jgi:acyl-CoA hydrolase